jgi:hypothetical protein
MESGLPCIGWFDGVQDAGDIPGFDGLLAGCPFESVGQAASLPLLSSKMAVLNTLSCWPADGHASAAADGMSYG